MLLGELLLSLHADQSTPVSRDEHSRGTLIYLRRRAWRYLRQLGQALPELYPEFAAQVLRHYPEDFRFYSSWIASQIRAHAAVQPMVSAALQRSEAKLLASADGRRLALPVALGHGRAEALSALAAAPGGKDPARLSAFYVLDLGDATLTLALSGWTDSGWAGISTFDLLVAGEADDLLVKKVQGELQRGGATVAALTERTGRPREAVRQALLTLIQRGQVVRDLAAGTFLGRPLFAEPKARLQQNDLPRLKDLTALAEALELPVPRLRWPAFHREVDTGTHYVRWTVPKRHGGLRLISAPKPQLKAAQAFIARQITERLPVHGAAHGLVPGRSTVTNARVHAGTRVVAKFALKVFYPSITPRSPSPGPWACATAATPTT